MNFLIQLLRFIVGGLFVFSGMVKAIDVQGTAYKLEEYFEIFGWHYFAEHSVVLATVFVLVEILLGVMLLLGYKKKFTLIALFITIVFFTFLTGFSAICNKVTDCGCFGDFIKLDPYESFYKDIVLLVMIIILWIGRRYIKPLFDARTDQLIMLFSLIISSFVAWHGLYRLPLVDFRPFAVGEDIRDGLYFEEPQTLSFYTLKNKNNNKDTVVTSTDYTETLWKDTVTYSYVGVVEGKDSIIEKGIEPKVKNFEIMDAQDNVIKEDLLEVPRLMLIIYPDDSQYCTVGEDNIKKLINEMNTANIKMEYLTLASHFDMIPGIPSAVLDDSTMKQMIRSNPGVMFLKKGVVVGKYHFNDLPEDMKTINNLYK